MADTDVNDDKKNAIDFSINGLAVRNEDTESSTTPALYKKLIRNAKKAFDKPGALYLAAETLPLNIVNENYKKVDTSKFPKKKLREFVRSFTDPHPIPIIRDHNTGEGGFFAPPEEPDVAGRVLTAEVAEVPGNSIVMGSNPRMSIFTGQIITKQKSIDKIYNLEDFSQSISFMPEAYVCEVCGGDIMLGTCSHRAGQVIKNEEDGKPTGERIIQCVIPDYAVEDSFVLVPAFRHAMIKAIEQNSATIPAPNLFYIEYNKRTMVNGISLPKDDDDESEISTIATNVSKLQTVNSDEQNNDTIEIKDNESADGGKAVNIEELQQQVKELSEMVKTLKESVEKNKAPENPTGAAPAEANPPVNEGSNNAAAAANSTGQQQDPTLSETVKDMADKFTAGLAEMQEQNAKIVEEAIKLVSATTKMVENAISNDNEGSTEEPVNPGEGEPENDETPDENINQPDREEDTPPTDGNGDEVEENKAKALEIGGISVFS